MYNYTLRYRTFDQLLVDVKNDFKKYQLDNIIDPQNMIKVAKKCNYELGLRINKTKEVVLEVEKGRVRLPLDFYTLNFMLMCGEYTIKQYIPQGTQTEERFIDPVVPEYQQAPPAISTCPAEPAEPDPCDPCMQCGNPCCEDTCNACTANPDSCSLNCKGQEYQLVQTLKYETRVFSVLKTVRLLENSMSIECDCPNLYWESPFTAWIEDGWLYTNFQTGKIYINYEGLMENEKGELLVLDHDMINEYYEYSLKQRILEDLIMDDQTVSQAKVQIIEARYRASRNNALSIVNTPNFSELKRVWKKNRKAQWSKYYDMFRSYPAPSSLGLLRDGSFNNGRWQNQ